MSKPGFLSILAWVPIGMILIGSIVGLIKLTKLGSSQKKLVWLLIITFLSECVSYYLSKSRSNTYPVFHFYAMVEYTLLALIFAKSFRSKIYSKILKTSIYFMVVYGALNVVFWQPLLEPNTNITIVSAVIMIFVSVLFFFRALNEMRYPQIEKSSMFWISIGVLIYFASSLTMFVYMRWLVPVNFNDVENVLLINILFNIIHYTCFNIALWMRPE